METGTNIGKAAQTAVAALQERLTTDLTGSAEVERKRNFLQVFRRWEALFKRADRGDVEAEKWLIAEYFKTLGHLSPVGLEALTEELKKRCTFFPSVKECLEVINVPLMSGDWGNPFINRDIRPQLYHPRKPMLTAPKPTHMLSHGEG